MPSKFTVASSSLSLSLCCLVLGASSVARAGTVPPWSTLGATSSRLARSIAVGPDDPLPAPAPWPYVTGRPVATSPVIDVDGAAYFASDIYVHAVDEFGTGRPIYRAPAAVQSSPTLFRTDGSDGAPGFAALYFGAENGSVTSIDLHGTRRWSVSVGREPIRSSPAVIAVGRDVYVAVADASRVYVLRETAGAAVLAWSMPVVADPFAMTSPAFSADGSRLFFATANGELRCNELVTGAPRGVFPAGRVGRLTTPLVTDLSTVVVGAEDGHVFQTDRDCNWIATSLPGGAVRAPAARADAGVVVNADGTLFLLDATTLGPLWSAPLPPNARRAPPLADNFGRVFLAGEDAMVHGVALPSPSTVGGLWWSVGLPFSKNSQLGPMAMAADGSLYVPGLEGWLHVLRDTPSFRIAHHRPGPSSSDLAFVNEIYGSVRSRTFFDVPGADDYQPSFDYGAERLAFARATASTPLDVFIGGRGLAPVSITTPGPGLSFTPSSLESEPAFSAVDPRTGASRLPDKQRYVGYTFNNGAGDRILFTDLGRFDRGLRTAIDFHSWAMMQGVPSAMAFQLDRPGLAQSQLALSPDGFGVAFRECPVGTVTGCVVQVLQWDVTHGLWTLTRLGSSGSETPPLAASSPAFSPDGRFLAVRVSGGLAVYPAVNSGLPFTIPNAAGETLDSPSWSPDGTELAAASTGSTFFFHARSIVIFSGPRFTKRTGASTGRLPNDDAPFYHYRRFPVPIAASLVPDRAFTGDVVTARGRGFDLVDLQANRVSFTSVLGAGAAAVTAAVVGGRVDPLTGEAVLSIQVPVQAGNGMMSIATRAGTAQLAFLVEPRPVALRQSRSAIGMKIRVSGTGFDLSGATPLTNTVVEFTAAAGGWVGGQVRTAFQTATGQQLDVEVPSGVAKTGPVRTWARTQAEGDTCCTFERLDPALALARSTGIPATAAEGCTGASMTFTGKDFPFDQDFGQGVGTATVAIGGVDTATSAPQATFVQSSTAPDTATFSLTRTLPGLPTGNPGGSLTVTATMDATPTVSATAMLRVPRANIPIVFVPGTSGNSLISSGAILPFVLPTGPLPPPLGHVHNFPQNSWPASFNDHLCSPPLLLVGCPPYIPYLTPGFFPGEEVWPGTKLPADLLNPDYGVHGNLGNHYLDVLAFTPAGTQLFPMVAGLPLRSYPIHGDIYGRLIDKLAGDLGRPIGSGANGVYLFGYDFRDSLPVQAAALSVFVDSVLATSGASSVVLVTQSLGGMVARAFYLSPAAAGKVDQVISQGGGFAGVPLTAKILAVGDTWGMGIGGPLLSGGIAEWEVQKLAQNWPTAYFQLPTAVNAASVAADPWFFDDGTIVTVGGAPVKVDRRYVRETRPGKTAPVATTASHVAWLTANHNPTVAGMVTTFAPTLPVAMGDFSMGTGPVIHQRIVSRGYPTVTGIRLDKPPGQGFTTKWAITGDGDGVVAYHGMIGLTGAGDDRVYVAEGTPGGPDFTHTPLVQNDRTITIIEGMINGTVCTQPQAAAIDSMWMSPATAPERYSETLVPGGASYEQLPSD